jgi:XTP/dITP diphosphohydrolase
MMFKGDTVKLVIASKNVHKIRELRAILKGIPHWDIYSLIDFPNYAPPEEIGQTFEENAILKATHASRELNVWALADDSGLVVPALGDKPGVYSARYAKENATDKENRKKLVKEMEGLNGHERDAYYACAIALASPQELEKTAVAYCEGEILTQEQGGGGFGYDPLFKKHEYNKTFAELEEEVKNRISHRRKALDKMALTLEIISKQLYESENEVHH